MTELINNFSCSFCDKSKNKIERLIIGGNVCICNECVYLYHDLLQKQTTKKNINEHKHWDYTPKELKDFLDHYVISQDCAKKVLSVAVYNHYKRLKNNSTSNEVELDKSNILLIGPTGSGKTLLAQTLARILNVPFTIADATTLTEAGYVGDDVESIIKNLLSCCNFNAKKAEFGIIFIDEIDKISKRSDSTSITRDVSGEGVQQALLKIIEGTTATVPPQGGRKHPQQNTISIDTSKILFICSGTFSGLNKIIAERISKTENIGFFANIKQKEHKKSQANLLELIKPADLIKFGLIPELVSRLPVQTTLKELDKIALIDILTKPKNCIVKQFQKMFLFDGVKLTFKKSALSAIADLTIKNNVGARGLRSIIEDLLLDTMFNIPSNKNIDEVIINKAVVTKKIPPIIITTKLKKANL